jgi:prepilin-type N-terminal cleavage/methylation domain-containing protein
MSLAAKNRKTQIRDGMTLVELLLVLVLLAMVATMTTIRFAAPLQRQRVLSAVQQWQSIDFFARKLSRTSNVSIRVERLQDRSIVSIERDGILMRNWSVSLPMSIVAEDLSGKTLEDIRFDRAQGSMDYRVVVREGTVQTRIEVAGGTGRVRHDP